MKKLNHLVLAFFCFVLNGNFLLAQVSGYDSVVAEDSLHNAIDIQSYDLDIDLYSCFSEPYPNSFSARQITTVKADADLTTLRLNASEKSLLVDSVGLSGKTFKHLNDTLFISLDRLYHKGESFRVMIFYKHKEVTDQAFYVSKNLIFTDSPPEGARKWMPCNDRPDDKATWELHALVKSPAKVASNGLMTEEPAISGDSATFHWKSTIPTSTYLLTIVAGKDFQLLQTFYNHPTSTSSNHPTSTLSNQHISTLSNHPISTLSNHPISTLSNQHISTLSNHPISTLSNHPISTLSNHPISTLSNHPISTLSNHPISTLSNQHITTSPPGSIPTLLFHHPNENTALIDSMIAPVTDYFASLFGNYPFEKIGFATLDSTFPWGGMENQGMVNLMRGGYSDLNLVVHEHAHEWFGNMITCGTWADVWLNEGFGTYCQKLWLEHFQGRKLFLAEMNKLAAQYLSANPGWPIYQVSWKTQTPSPDQLYNVAITYNKGACVLHMLRNLIGDTLFFKTLHDYANNDALKYKSAVTEDFVRITNQVTGEDLHWFFDQWVFQPNHPKYVTTSRIDSTALNTWGLVYTINQVQENTGFFRMPVELLVKFSDGTHRLVSADNTENHQDFRFTFDKKPVAVTFDPEQKIILKEIEYEGITKNPNSELPH